MMTTAVVVGGAILAVPAVIAVLRQLSTSFEFTSARQKLVLSWVLAFIPAALTAWVETEGPNSVKLIKAIAAGLTAALGAQGTYNTIRVAKG